MSEWPSGQSPVPLTCGLRPWRLDLVPLTHIKSITVNYYLSLYSHAINSVQFQYEHGASQAPSLHTMSG